MRVAATMVLLAVAGCSMPDSADPQAGSTLSTGGVAKIAEAPDGTILWGVRSRGTTVYFSSAGASWTASCGKNCATQEQVPNSVPIAQ